MKRPKSSTAYSLRKRHDFHRPVFVLYLVIGFFAFYFYAMSLGAESNISSVLHSVRNAAVGLAEIFSSNLDELFREVSVYYGFGDAEDLVLTGKMVTIGLAVIIAPLFALYCWCNGGLYGALYSIKEVFCSNLPSREFCYAAKSFKGKCTIDENLIEVMDEYIPDGEKLIREVYERAGIRDVYVSLKYVDADGYGREIKYESEDGNVYRGGGIYQGNGVYQSGGLHYEAAMRMLEPISTIERSGYISVVEVSPVLFIALSEYIHNDEMLAQVVRFTFAHEFIHVRYHDPLNMKWRVVLFLFVWGFGLSKLTQHAYFTVVNGSKPAAVLSVVVLLIWIIFVSVTVNVTYWCQSLEFRADRLAVRISGADPAVVFAAYEMSGIGLESGKRYTPGDRMTEYMILLKKVFSRNYVIDSIVHPSTAVRKHEAQCHTRWSPADYIRYAWMMRMNLLSGKGGRIQ